MKKIKLNGKYGEGKTALVDDEDFEWLSKWKWFARKAKTSRTLYAQRTTGSGVMMHRVIMERHGLLEHDKQIDHRDHNGLNCQKYNLRSCTGHQNKMNKRTFRKTGSKFKGVYKHVSSYKSTVTSNTTIYEYWYASIQINGKSRKLGQFEFSKDGEIQAALAYNEAAKRIYGEFANLNQIL